MVKLSRLILVVTITLTLTFPTLISQVYAVNYVQTDKTAYNINEVIHVTGQSVPDTVRVQITHLDGVNILNAWIGFNGNSFQYDIDLLPLHNGNLIVASANYVINAIDIDNNILASTTVYISTSTTNPPSTPQLNSTQAVGQVQILGTCGLSFPNGNNVNYGGLVPNTISAEKKLNVTNTGTVSAILRVTGADWKDSGNNSVMLANRTHYNVTSGTYSQKSPLQTSEQIVTTSFLPSSILQTFWQLQTVTSNPSFAGSTTQTMNFAVSCDSTTVEITSTDPDNGYLSMSGPSCSTSPITRTVIENRIFVGPRLYNPDISAAGCYRAWTTWDVSGIPDSAVIQDMQMKFEKLPKSNPSTTGNVHALLYSLESKPNLVSDSTLRTDIRDGTLYVNGDPNFSVDGNHTTSLGPVAVNALTNKLYSGTDWFGVGISASNESTSSWNLAEIRNLVLVVKYS